MWETFRISHVFYWWEDLIVGINVRVICQGQISRSLFQRGKKNPAALAITYECQVIYISYFTRSLWSDLFFGNKVKLICRGQGLISRSHLTKKWPLRWHYCFTNTTDVLNHLSAELSSYFDCWVQYYSIKPMVDCNTILSAYTLYRHLE